MSFTSFRSVLAAALAVCAVGAHAQSSLWYSASLGDEVSGNRADTGMVELPNGVFTTGGLLSWQAGPAGASLSALADPTNGMFKSYVRAQVNAGGAHGSSSAQALFKLNDTLTFSGPGDSVEVTFDFHWDSVISGIDAAASERQGDAPFVPTRMFSSSQSMKFGSGSTSGTGDPCNGEPFCEFSGGPILTEPPRPVVEITGWGVSGPDNVRFDGLRDGHYSGGMTRSFTVAAGSSVDLVYVAQSSVQCFFTSLCDLTLDSSHSDYIGITLSPGASFSSANGYRYLGFDGVAAPVPEPATWALALLGLAAVALRSRRQPA